MRETPVCTAADAIYKLAAGNLKYLNAENGSGDISRRIRMSTWAKGQSPYASSSPVRIPGSSRRTSSRRASVSCSSSGWRATSSTTISWGSIEVRCRPSGLSAGGGAGPHPLRRGGCGHQLRALRLYPLHHGRDKKGHRGRNRPYKASCLNVRHSVQEIEKSLCIHNIEEETGLRVVGAMYHIEDGSVEFL